MFNTNLAVDASIMRLEIECVVIDENSNTFSEVLCELHFVRF